MHPLAEREVVEVSVFGIADVVLSRGGRTPGLEILINNGRVAERILKALAVPISTVGGEVNFDPAYDGNILVNAMTVGAEQVFAIASRAAHQLMAREGYVQAVLGETP